MFDGSPTNTSLRHQRGVLWTRTSTHNLAKIAVPSPDPREWRALLDQLRPSTRPLVLWMRGRVWLGAEGREALARAIGSSKVALIVEDNVGRSLATALEWLGVEISTYTAADLERLETEFEFEPGSLDDLIAQLA